MNANDLTGTWFLGEAYAVGPRGSACTTSTAHGSSGVIHYGDDGRMMALITHDGREWLDGDRQAAPEAQRAQAYKSSIAYAGRFTLEAGWISHWVDVSTYPNWVGTALRRALSFEQGDAVLTTAPQMQDGVETVIKLVWRRQPVES
ncbi:lipocalin-like domain-containing protein [Achromobacter xylosoxidans]